jgi:hypothetical protein
MTWRKGFCRHKAIKGSELSSIAWRDQRWQRGQTSICGNSAWQASSTKIELELTGLCIHRLSSH